MMVVIDRLPITLDVAVCRRFGSPDAYLRAALASVHEPADRGADEPSGYS